MVGFLVYDLVLEKGGDTEDAQGNYWARGYAFVVG